MECTQSRRRSSYIRQKETKLTKFPGTHESASSRPKNLRFLGYLLLKSSDESNRRKRKFFALKLNQAPPRRVSNGLCAADDIHLGENTFHMRLDGALTNKEGRADLFVAFALRHQFEHID